MVMHVCSVAQEIAENCCEGNHQEQDERERGGKDSQSFGLEQARAQVSKNDIN
jgi:hypothetical protein